MNKMIAALIAVIVFLLAAGAWFFFISLPVASVTPVPVTIGTTPFEVSGLIFIAEDQGYFERNGILPTIRMYDAGINAVDALYTGDVDIATAADFVFARQVLEGRPVRAIASLGKSEFHYIIARNDTGIRNISDLKGKKVGVARGTSGDFFLGRFLEFQGMTLRDITIVDLPPARVAVPLVNGSVDAVSTWDPYATATEKRLGDNVRVWPDQKGRPMYWIALCRKDYITGNGTEVLKVLSALRQAEKISTDHPDKAKTIVRKRLGTDDAYLGRVWPHTQLTLSLDQSLVFAVEDEARWIIANNLTDATALPDITAFISTGSLNKINPGSVNIITRGERP